MPPAGYCEEYFLGNILQQTHFLLDDPEHTEPSGNFFSMRLNVHDGFYHPHHDLLPMALLSLSRTSSN